MPKNVRFFDSATDISNETLPFSSREKCLQLAQDNPNKLIEYLKEECTNQKCLEGKHPVLGDLLDFAFDVQRNHQNNKDNTVITFLNTVLPSYYKTLAHESPKSCSQIFQREDDNKRLFQVKYGCFGKHLIFGDLNQFKNLLELPKTHAVIQTLDKALERQAHVINAYYHPTEYREKLKTAFEANIIKKGIHPELGNLSRFARELYQITPDMCDCGPNVVLSYLVKLGAWNYPMRPDTPFSRF